MNWNKAKSILLICFLIIDAVLLSMYLKRLGEGEKDLSISKADAIELLNKQGIAVNEAELKDGGGYKGLIVRYHDFDIDRANQIFFDGKAELDDRYELKILAMDDRSVSISQGNLFSYMDASEETRYPNLDEKEAKSIAEKFIEENSLNIRDLVFDGAYKDENAYQVHYAIKHDESYLENSFVNFTIDKRGIRRLDMMYLEYINTEDEEIKLGDVKDKILSIIDKPEVQDKSIASIDMCYYLDEVTLDQSYELKITRLRAKPHWRITFTDGYKMIL